MTNKEIYASLCAQHDDIPIFMQAWWMDAVCAGKEWDVLLCTDQDKVLAAMPYLIRKRLGMRYVVMPQQTQIGGIWLNPDYPTQDVLPAICQEMADRLSAMKLCYYYQHYPVGSPCPSLFRSMKYRVRERVTYRVNDLQDMDRVIASFSKNKRRQLQKALSLNVNRQMNVEDFYRFHTRCMAEQKKQMTYTREFLLVLERKPQRLGQSCIISVSNGDGELCAAAFLVWDHSYLYYLIPCYSPLYKDSGAGALLALEAMKVAREKGVKFDFEGSMDRGTAQHYRQFGSTPATYYSVSKLYRWYFLSALIYNWIHNLKFHK